LKTELEKFEKGTLFPHARLHDLRHLKVSISSSISGDQHTNMSQRSSLDSATWYDENAQEFLERTLNLDMTALYEPFLRHMKLGGHILDAGYGSGRDTVLLQESLQAAKRGFAAPVSVAQGVR
jgi:hypothetical protein